MKKRPLTYFLFAYLTGLAFNHKFDFPQTYLLTSALLLTLAAVLLYRQTQKTKPVLVMLLIAVIPWAGWWQRISSCQLTTHHVSNFAKAQNYLIKGRLSAPPRKYSYKKQFIIDTEKLTRKGESHLVEGKIQVNCYLEYLSLAYGDSIEFWARLRPPTSYRNPGGFDCRAYLARRGILATASLYSFRQLVNIKNNKESGLFKLIYRLKSKLGTFLVKETTQPKQGILQTILLGGKETLLPNIKHQFSRTGIAHLLSISGLHLSFIAFLIFQVIRKSLLWFIPPKYLESMVKYGKPSQLAAFVSIPCLLFYVFLVGARTATIRALIMVCTYLVSVILERDRDLYNTLALAALLILIYQPSALLEVDFQLSFGVVFFLITASQLPYKSMRIPAWLFCAVAIPIVASLAASPLTAYHFQNISLIGFMANMLIVPLATLLIPLGLLACFSSLLHPFIGTLLITPALWILDLILKLTHFFSQFPSASIYPGIWQIIMFYLLLYGALRAAKDQRARYALLPLLIGTVLVFWKPASGEKKRLRITFVDVGQGDAGLIEFPNGQNMLIDGGGTQNDQFDIGGKVLAPFLRYRRIDSINTVVLSHPHPDHINGLKSILNQFKVENIWEGTYPQTDSWQEYDSQSYRQFKNLAEQYNVPRKFLSAGQKFQVGEVLVEVLHPPAKGFYGSLNDQSLVVRIEYKEASLLFTGDIGEKAQKWLVSRYPEKLASTILKAPHHGAADAYFALFLKLINPKAAIFSAGLYNKYRHPNARVRKKYKNQGVQIYRTDKQGAITVTTDGINCRVKPFIETSLH